MQTSPPFTGSVLIDATIAFFMFLAGVWIFLSDRPKTGSIVIGAVLVWAWRLFAVYY